MKIGILTFHWATNYGAVLQSFALQTYLVSIGHEVKIIDYKPKRYNYNLISILRSIKNKQFTEYYYSLKKEKWLQIFRDNHLHKTGKVYSFDQLSRISQDFDCIISGSDQVMNPYFLMSGDENGKITPSYYLGFPFDGKRVAYAVSFGCVNYPDQAREVASRYISAFDKIGVRESSGVDIIKSMGRDGVVNVPDPTILLDTKKYIEIANSSSNTLKPPYIYSFFIRNIQERKKAINSLQMNQNILWNNDDKDYSLEGWLSKIQNAAFVITDSFHCMLICLKLHTPFAVVTEIKGNVGMNDRFYSLLEKMEMTNRIFYKENLLSILNLEFYSIDWVVVDNNMNKCKSFGIEFLKNI